MATSGDPRATTCTSEYLQSLPASKARQELADKCLARGEFKPPLGHS
ncbi:entry exclusion lipoprotein TrbK [Achromobacter sp. UMC46]